MNKEFEFLNIISKNLSDNSYLGDDCAYLKDLGIVVSSDSLIEDVHFKLEYMNPSELARKSLLVNISDILASGAKPCYATISLSGKLNEKFIDEFYLGIDKTAQEFDLKIIGGDLTKSDKLMISVTIIGKIENGNISSRSNAKEGYLVCVCGFLGSSAQGLEDLFKGIKNNEFICAHKNPKLFLKTSQNISKKAKKPYAMMDISDGLVDCLVQISSKSKVKIDFNYDKIPHKTTNKDYVLFGGEDYGLVCCLNEQDFKNINDKNLIPIGFCSKGFGVFMDDKKIELLKGFKHFD